MSAVTAGEATSGTAGGPSVLTHRLFDGRSGEEDGDTGTLLMLNGGFMSIAAWQPLSAPLAEHLPTLCCDFRGQLRTPGPSHRRLGPNVDDAVALLDHLELPRVHVLGASFGGLVGLLLAAQHPERVASLVAVTVSDRTTEAMEDGNRRLRPVVESILAGGDRTSFHRDLVPDIYSADYIASHGEALAERGRQLAGLPDVWFAALDGLLTAVETFDLSPELPRVHCPTTVLLAADDRVMPVERGRAVAEGVPEARLEIHPTSGHGLVAEDPAWVVERTLEHLGRLP